MHSYPRNSPEAAARIVALVLIADGHVSQREIDALQHLQLEHELGLAPGRFGQVVHTLCEDLLLGSYGSGSMTHAIDDLGLAALMSDVESPPLREAVLRLARGAAEADQHLAEAEAWILDAARRHWGLQDEVRQPPAAVSAG